MTSGTPAVVVTACVPPGLGLGGIADLIQLYWPINMSKWFNSTSSSFCFRYKIRPSTYHSSDSAWILYSSLFSNLSFCLAFVPNPASDSSFVVRFRRKNGPSLPSQLVLNVCPIQSESHNLCNISSKSLSDYPYTASTCTKSFEKFGWLLSLSNDSYVLLLLLPNAIPMQTKFDRLPSIHWQNVSVADCTSVFYCIISVRPLEEKQ